MASFTTTLFKAVRSADVIFIHGYWMFSCQNRGNINEKTVIGFSNHAVKCAGFLDQVITVTEDGKSTAVNLDKTIATIQFLMHRPTNENDIQDLGFDAVQTI